MRYLLLIFIVCFFSCKNTKETETVKVDLVVDKATNAPYDTILNSKGEEATAKGGGKGKPSAAIAAFNIAISISGNTVSYACNGFLPQVVLMLHGTDSAGVWTTIGSHPLCYRTTSSNGCVTGSYTYSVFGQTLMLPVGYSSLVRVYSKDTNGQHQASEPALLTIQ